MSSGDDDRDDDDDNDADFVSAECYNHLPALVRLKKGAPAREKKDCIEGEGV